MIWTGVGWKNGSRFIWWLLWASPSLGHLKNCEVSFTKNFEQILTLKLKFCNTKSWKNYIQFLQQSYLTWLNQIGKRRNWHMLELEKMPTWNNSLSKIFDWQMFFAKMLILPNIFDVNKKETISEMCAAVWCLFYWLWTNLWLYGLKKIGPHRIR